MKNLIGLMDFGDLDPGGRNHAAGGEHFQHRHTAYGCGALSLETGLSMEWRPGAPRNRWKSKLQS